MAWHGHVGVGVGGWGACCATPPPPIPPAPDPGAWCTGSTCSADQPVGVMPVPVPVPWVMHARVSTSNLLNGLCALGPPENDAFHRTCAYTSALLPAPWPPAPCNLQPPQGTALPMTIHISEMAANRARAAGGETFHAFSTCSVQVRVGVGIVRVRWEGAGGHAAHAVPQACAAARTGMHTHVLVWHA